MTIRQAGNIIAGAVTNLIPVGTILPYGGSTAPEGYLLCNGQAVSRTTYSDLFDVIGTTYGTGDGNTTFNLPALTSIITSVNTNVPCKGNGIALGITNGTTNGGLNNSTGSDNRYVFSTTNYGSTVGTVSSTSNYVSATDRTVLGITTDASKSGIVGTVTRTSMNCKAIIKY